MLHLADKNIIGTPFEDTSGKVYTCLGYGVSPGTSAVFFVGMEFDTPNNRTLISTHLAKNIKFIGKIPNP